MKMANQITQLTTIPEIKDLALTEQDVDCINPLKEIPSDSLKARSQTSITSISTCTSESKHCCPLSDSCPLTAYLCSILSADYHEFSKIGQGTYGTVYHAKHKATGKEVAIKVLMMGLDSSNSYQRRQMFSEIQVMRKLAQ